MQSFTARKEQKKHGTKKFIEGIETPRGLNVVIIDDVCTKGDSTGLAIDHAQDAGMNVLGAVCLVDREAGARELLARKYGLRLESIFTLSQLRTMGNRHSLAVAG